MAGLLYDHSLLPDGVIHPQSFDIIIILGGFYGSCLLVLFSASRSFSREKPIKAENSHFPSS